jgi:hypothetical protein
LDINPERRFVGASAVDTATATFWNAFIPSDPRLCKCNFNCSTLYPPCFKLSENLEISNFPVLTLMAPSKLAFK